MRQYSYTGSVFLDVGSCTISLANVDRTPLSQQGTYTYSWGQSWASITLVNTNYKATVCLQAKLSCPTETHTYNPAMTYNAIC